MYTIAKVCPYISDLEQFLILALIMAKLFSLFNHLIREVMQNAKKGDTVRVHYTGKLENGDIFDSSQGKDPLEFEIGKNQVLKKFEDSVEGMNIGDKAEIRIPAAEAYGNRNEELVVNIPTDRLPENLNPEVGMKLQMKTKDEQIVVVTILGITEDSLTVDANHELADKDLHFDIELVEIL